MSSGAPVPDDWTRVDAAWRTTGALVNPRDEPWELCHECIADLRLWVEYSPPAALVSDLIEQTIKRFGHDEANWPPLTREHIARLTHE
jgi:hypothetical protein